MRRLIVNADDFGLSAGVNRGIVEAHERGIVTSASLMVHRPAASEAAAYAKGREQLAVGLHVDLGEWLFTEDAWVARYEVAGSPDEAVRRQLQQFRRLLGRDPTHLDSHQHVHRTGAARESVAALGAELGVPVRELDPTTRYDGRFYGQDDEGKPFPDLIGVQALVGIFRELGEGITELGCHPGYTDGLESSYLHERLHEVATLCDARVRAALESEGIELTSFAAVTA